MEQLGRALLQGLASFQGVPLYEWALFSVIVASTSLYWALDCHFVGSILHPSFDIKLLNHPESTVAQALRSCCSLQKYWPTPWLCSPHLQTLYLHYSKAAPKISYQREILRTVDGGTVGLDWAESVSDPSRGLQPTAPTVVIVPGLTSDSNNGYIRHLVAGCLSKGWRALVVNHRGCGGVPLTSDQFYNAGWTDDLRMSLKHVKAKLPRSPLGLIGTSLGANIAVKYAGEEGSSAFVLGVVAIGCPFDLQICDRSLHRTKVSQMYGKALAVGLVEAAVTHRDPMSRVADWAMLSASRTVREFDDNFTRVTGKFETVDEYYRQSSCSQYITAVRRPLLCISALDDPICCREALPYDECKRNPYVVLATSPRGGHLAFFEGFFAQTLWWVKPTTDFFSVIFSTPSLQEPAPASSTMATPTRTRPPLITLPTSVLGESSRLRVNTDRISKQRRAPEEALTDKPVEVGPATPVVDESPREASSEEQDSSARRVVLDFKDSSDLATVELVLSWLLQRLRQSCPATRELEAEDPRASAAACAAAASSAAASASAMAAAAAAMVKSSRATARRLKLDPEVTSGADVDWEMGTPVGSQGEPLSKQGTPLAQRLEGRLKRVSEKETVGLKKGNRVWSTSTTSWVLVYVAVAVTFPLVGAIVKRRLSQNTALKAKLQRGFR